MLYHQRLALRRTTVLLKWAGALALGAGLLGAGWVKAQDLPTEFSGFQRLPEPAARSFVSPQQWERISRPADRMGPRPLRPVDQQLLDAAREQRWPQVLELLTKQGAEADAMDLRGANVLVMAARHGQGEVVRELLRRGAVTSRRGDDGFTALGAAAFFGHTHLVLQLLKAGADPALAGATGHTPLHLAALAGRGAVVDRLLRQACRWTC